MTDKADIVVWEKDTETKKVKKVTLKQIVCIVNNQNDMNEMSLVYYLNKKDIKWASGKK